MHQSLSLPTLRPISRLLRVVPFCSAGRKIHARAEQFPLAHLERKKLRPLKNFVSPGEERFPTKADSRVVLQPTGVKNPAWTASNSQLKKRIQMARTADSVLQLVTAAIRNGTVEITVFGAAMQKCGQLKAWDALKTIRDLQKHSGFKLTEIELSIYLHSLAECVRVKGGVLRERQLMILSLGREAWSDSMPFHVTKTCIGSVIAVCAAAAPVAKSESLRWAEEMLLTSKNENVHLDEVEYTPFVNVLAWNNLHGKVDELLRSSSLIGWSPNEVTLGGLINICAETYNAERAEDLWRIFTQTYAVTPHVLAHRARAKAHIMSGRPSEAINALQSMEACGFPLEHRSALMLLQARLILYHAFANRADHQKFLESVRRTSTIEHDAFQRESKQMQQVCNMIRRRPGSVLLADVLISPLARKSTLAKQTHHISGSSYLQV